MNNGAGAAAASTNPSNNLSVDLELDVKIEDPSEKRRARRQQAAASASATATTTTTTNRGNANGGGVDGGDDIEEMEEEIVLKYGAAHVIKLFIPVTLCLVFVIISLSLIKSYQKSDGATLYITSFFPLY